MGVRVTSSKMCFYHGQRFRPGEVFELPDGVRPSPDMKVVEGKAEVKPRGQKPRGDGPTTFSEIARADHKAMAPKGADDLI